jgi:hypothetical protein
LKSLNLESMIPTEVEKKDNFEVEEEKDFE